MNWIWRFYFWGGLVWYCCMITTAFPIHRPSITRLWVWHPKASSIAPVVSTGCSSKPKLFNGFPSGDLYLVNPNYNTTPAWIPRPKMENAICTCWIMNSHLQAGSTFLEMKWPKIRVRERSQGKRTQTLPSADPLHNTMGVDPGRSSATSTSQKDLVDQSGSRWCPMAKLVYT